MNQRDRQNLIYMKFIESQLDIFGYVGSKCLCEQFSMHRSSASKALTLYRELVPSNTRYNVKESRHDKSFTFQKKFLTESSLEFLNNIESMYGSCPTYDKRLKDLNEEKAELERLI